jgi:hypothetical protein
MKMETSAFCAVTMPSFKRGHTSHMLAVPRPEQKKQIDHLASRLNNKLRLLIEGILKRVVLSEFRTREHRSH